MTWLLPDGLGLVVFGSANHQPTMNIAMTAEGSESVRLRHDYNMQSVSDTVTIHVVDVAITEAPELAVGLPALGPGHFTVHAVGTPSPGFYVWTIRDHHIVEFPGGLDPENHAAPQFPATAAGTSGIDVAYTFMGVTVWDSLIVTWWPFAFRKRRSRHAPSTVHRPRRNSSCLRWASRREAHFCGKTETVRRSRPKAH